MPKNLCDRNFHYVFFPDFVIFIIATKSDTIDIRGYYITLVNIGSGNGLVPSGTKPLPDSMLTFHQLWALRYAIHVLSAATFLLSLFVKFYVKMTILSSSCCSSLFLGGQLVKPFCCRHCCSGARCRCCGCWSLCWCSSCTSVTVVARRTPARSEPAHAYLGPWLSSHCSPGKNTLLNTCSLLPFMLTFLRYICIYIYRYLISELSILQAN